MNTNRVKNIVIVMFVILNAALFGLIQWENSRFRLSASQESAVRELFMANGIDIDADIPRNFRPMSGLYVVPFIHDINVHGERFFTENTPSLEYGWDSVSLRVGERVLTLDGLTMGDYLLLYENPGGFVTTEFLRRGFMDVEASREAVEEFINNVTPPELNFIFNFEVWDEDSFIFDYRGYYQGYIIRDNFIRVRVNEKGIIGATFRFGCIPYGFSSDSREIFSADEALFTVLQALLPRHVDSDITVVGIRMAYYLADRAADDYMTKAIPCYKISVEIDGDTQIFWVDAYTGRL